ncbi:MAG: YdeI/OmpD-associated family protein [bacterium]|nr:YdeI/OmpD-associated family protein [bacterium]
MPEFDKRIDAYIEKSRDFARPILEHLRKLVHKACPDVEETIKWGSPHFDYKGSLAGMAAFKEHCAFGFWKQKLMDLRPVEATAMGSFGRIASLKDLPKDKEIVALLHHAMELNEKGIKVPKKPAAVKADVIVPDALAAALAQNKKASAAFDKFSPSHRREYVEWVTEAKTEPTRNKRIATTIEWLIEGKSRNWKYESTKKSGA